MSEPLRIGVVGAGAIAQVAHLPAIAGVRGTELAGICDIDVPKGRALAGRFEVPEVYDDIEDLLQYARPDAVVICTPNHLHEVHVITALSAGVDVLCERPLALSVEGVERIRAARERAGRAVLVGMNHRFRSDVQAVRGFLTGGELGALHSIRGGWYTFRPTGQPAGWRTRKAQSGGGAMLDLGLPLVDLALWLAGCPRTKRVTAALASRDQGEVEHSGCALIMCEGGLSVFVDVSWHHIGQEEVFWFGLMGTNGSARLAPLQVFKEMHGTPMEVTPTGAAGRESMFSASYRAEWAHFLAIVRGEVETPGLTDQLILHRTLEAIRRSATEGRDVAL